MEEQKIIYEQPLTTEVKIYNKCNAKGEPTPEIKLTIGRKLKGGEKIIEIIEKDMRDLIEKAKNGLKSLRELS